MLLSSRSFSPSIFFFQTRTRLSSEFSMISEVWKLFSSSATDPWSWGVWGSMLFIRCRSYLHMASHTKWFCDFTSSFKYCDGEEWVLIYKNRFFLIGMDWPLLYQCTESITRYTQLLIQEQLLDLPITMTFYTTLCFSACVFGPQDVQTSIHILYCL